MIIRIILAVGNPSFQDGIRRVLSARSDLRILAEPTGTEATLSAIELHAPDIVLLDIDGAGSSGWAVLQELRAREEPRVILLTSSENRAVYVQALRLGAAGIVHKRTAADLLVKSIRKVHAGEAWLDGATLAEVMREFASRPQSKEGAEARDIQSSPLSERERQIVGWVAQGMKNRDIAARMSICDQTVKNHLHNVFKKLGVSDRLELTLYAIHKNLATER